MADDPDDSTALGGSEPNWDESQSILFHITKLPPPVSPGIIPAPKGMWPPPASTVPPPGGDFYVVPAGSDALTRAGGDPTLRDLTLSSWPISKVTGGPMPPPPPPSDPLLKRAWSAVGPVVAPLLTEELNEPSPPPIPQVVPPSGRIGREPTPLLAGAIDLAGWLAPEAKAVGPARRAYSVAFETIIPKVGAGDRPAHFTAANKLLRDPIASDPEVARMMDQFGVQVPKRLSESPEHWSWHHVADRPGVMQLVPRWQHQSSAFRPLFHPQGRGGFARWGADY
jgi:hypothetical protein